MLLGTTFAWFTDSVTSANNIIKSGNLDVELYYQMEEWDDTRWDKVDADTNVFKENTLWEPGHTEVVKLKVVNEGSLALKYQLGVNVASETGSKNVAGDDFKLSDYIKYAIVEGASSYSDSASAATAVDANANKLNVAYDSGVINLEKGTDKIVTVVVYMPETVGNEANYGKGEAVPTINLGINLAATQLNSEKDSFGPNYDEPAELPDVTVYNATELQNVLSEATEDTTIVLAGDITEDITIAQKSDVEVVIDGNGHKVTGGIVVDGKSSTIRTAGVVIQNVNFKANNIDEDACINLGKSGNNNTRYTCNVTVKNCTFDVPGKVAIKSYTGGDKNLTISNCTAKAGMHSLVQVAGVDGLVIENCKVYSKNGINVNQSDNVKISGCTVDTTGYAVRFGASSGNTGTAEKYLIENCTLKSACEDGDAVIILRGTAESATLTINNTTIAGTTAITNSANATIVQ